MHPNHPGEAVPVMHRPDETRRTLLVAWPASIGLNANDIPADSGELTVTRHSLGALQGHWLETVSYTHLPLPTQPPV